MANCVFYVKSFREKFDMSGGECWTVVRRRKPGKLLMEILRDRGQDELK